MGIVLAIFASITNAIGDIFLKKGYKTLSPFASFFLISIFGLILWPLSIFFVKYDPVQLPIGLIYGLISGFLGQGYYIYVISKGELSITGTLLSTYPIFTVIFSIFINHEAISALGIIAILLMVLGTITVAIPSDKTKEFIKPMLIILPITAALGIGFSDSLSKRFINNAGAGTFLIATAFMQLLVSIFCLLLTKTKLSEISDVFKTPLKYKFAIFGSLGLAIDIMFFFLAFQFMNASIVAPIVGTAPIFIILFARIFLKEKLSKKNLFGIILVISGILLASI